MIHQDTQTRWAAQHAEMVKRDRQHNAKLNKLDCAKRIKKYGEDHNAEIEARAKTGINALLLNAGHDVNGNPRRAFLITDKRGSVVGVHNEGYAGEHGMRLRWPKVGYSQITIPTTATVLREWYGKAVRQTQG